MGYYDIGEYSTVPMDFILNENYLKRRMNFSKFLVGNLSWRRRRIFLGKNQSGIFWRTVMLVMIVYCAEIYGQTPSSSVQPHPPDSKIPSINLQNYSQEESSNFIMIAIPSETFYSVPQVIPFDLPALSHSQNSSAPRCPSLESLASLQTSQNDSSNIVMIATPSGSDSQAPSPYPKNSSAPMCPSPESLASLQTSQNDSSKFIMIAPPSGSDSQAPSPHSQNSSAPLGSSPDSQPSLQTSQNDSSSFLMIAMPSDGNVSLSQAFPSASQDSSLSHTTSYDSQASSTIPRTPDSPLLRKIEPNEDEVACKTKGCLATSEFIINNMDKDHANPCDDFYQFACGGFMKNAQIPKYEGVTSTFHLTEDAILEKFQKTLSEAVNDEDIEPHKLIKQFYTACVKGDGDNLNPIKNVLKQLGGWPVLESNWNEESFAWKDTIYEFRKLGFNDGYFLQISSSLNLKQLSSKKMIEIKEISYGINREFLVEGRKNKKVDAYYKYMVDIAVHFGADQKRAEEELLNSLNFEIQLANYTEPVIPNLTFPLPINDLQKVFPSIPWLEYINKILTPFVTVNSSDILQIRNHAYISNLATLLKNTPKRVLANYVFWRAVDSSARFLTDSVINRRLAFDTVLYGMSESMPRWIQCFKIISDKLKLAIGSLYGKKNFPPEDKEAARNLIIRIHNETLKILNTSDWMDESVKKKSVYRTHLFKNFILSDINSISSHPVLNDKFLIDYYCQLQIDSNQFFMSYLNISKFGFDKKFSMLKSPSSRENDIKNLFEQMMVIDFNEYYEKQSSDLLQFASIFQYPIFSSDRPSYLNFAELGLIFAHLFALQLDNEERSECWTPKTRQQFLQKAQCFVDKYNDQEIEGFNKKVNGTSARKRLVAISGAISIAYNAFFQNWFDIGTEEKLPKLLDFTLPQMFWINAANLFCMKYTPEMLETEIITKPDFIPIQSLVNGLFANNPDFTCDFNCTSNSKMNSPNKCQVWG